MSQSVFLGSYGKPISGMLPGQAFRYATNAAVTAARNVAQDTYKSAQSGVQRRIVDIRSISPTLLKRGTQATSQLINQAEGAVSRATAQAQDFASEMGASAAQGAQSEFMATVKTWAPWAIGGAAVAGLGIWLMRR